MKFKFFHRFLLSHFVVVLFVIFIVYTFIFFMTPRFVYDMKVKDLQHFGNYLLTQPSWSESEPFLETTIRIKEVQKGESVAKGWNVTSKEWQQLNEGETLSFQRERRHFQTTMTVVIVPIKTNQALILSMPTTETDQWIKEIRVVLTVVFLLALMIVFLISYLLAKPMQTRIGSLQKATNDIADGKYDIRILISGSDELTDLALDINKMAEQLEKKEAELKRMVVLRSQFLADISHELKTPLTSIRGLVTALRQNIGNKEEQERSLFLIENETLRLIRLVHSVMDLEKIRSGEMELHMKQIELYPFLSDIVEQMEYSIDERKALFLQLEVPKTLYVEADEDRLKQMMINLIRNAIQFTEKGTITVRGKEENDRMFLSVTDTGIGLTKEQQQDIFERFYKVDPSRTKKEGEVGIGLSVVKQLALAHHGDVQVESKVGEGSCFTIVLPKLQKN